MGVFPPPFSTATIVVLLSGTYFTATSYVKEYFKAPVVEEQGEDIPSNTFLDNIKEFFGGVPNLLTAAILLLDVLAITIVLIFYLGFCDSGKPEELKEAKPEAPAASSGETAPVSGADAAPKKESSFFKSMGQICTGSKPGKKPAAPPATTEKPKVKADDTYLDKPKPKEQAIGDFPHGLPPSLPPARPAGASLAPAKPMLSGSGASPKPKPPEDGDQSI